MLSLPTELIRRIIESITDNPTLNSLLLVSPILNYEAERVIYRKVSPKGRENQEKLFQQLHGSRRVDKYVIGLYLDIYDDDVSVNDLPYWSSLSLALRNLINLKAIHIWYFGFRPVPQVERLFDECPFQLESFSWPFPLTEKFFNFLENQRQIQRLSISRRFARTQVSSNALPQLSMLVGSTGAINALLPGRQVTHLSWVPGFGEQPDLARIGPALENIRVLKYAELFVASQLHTMISCLGKLEVLEWNPTGCQAIIDNASFFSHLRKIILYSSISFISTESEIDILFACIPTLLLVDSRVGEEAFRWFRGSDRPEPILLMDHWMFC